MNALTVCLCTNENRSKSRFYFLLLPVIVGVGLWWLHCPRYYTVVYVVCVVGVCVWCIILYTDCISLCRMVHSYNSLDGEMFTSEVGLWTCECLCTLVIGDELPMRRQRSYVSAAVINVSLLWFCCRPTVFSACLPLSHILSSIPLESNYHKVLLYELVLLISSLALLWQYSTFWSYLRNISWQMGFTASYNYRHKLTYEESAARIALFGQVKVIRFNGSHWSDWSKCHIP